MTEKFWFCTQEIVTASLYIRKSLLNRTIDSDIKVLDHILLTLASDHDEQKAKPYYKLLH
jgi:hypothetical protein